MGDSSSAVSGRGLDSETGDNAPGPAELGSDGNTGLTSSFFVKDREKIAIPIRTRTQPIPAPASNVDLFIESRPLPAPD